jgi:two-component system sensor histidine kinase UhpB
VTRWLWWNYFDVPLFWRVFMINAAVIVAAAAVLAATPGHVHVPTSLVEGLTGAIALSAVLAFNLALLRPAFDPLRRLTALMERIDLLQPGQRLEVSGRGEVATLVASFNDMLARLESERQESVTLTLRAREEERRRIARNLHDEIGQTLTTVILQLDRLRKRVRPELDAELAEATNTVRVSLDQVRSVAMELRPGVLDDLGLSSALRELCTTFSHRSGLQIDRRIAGSLPPLSKDAEVVLYRVAQEGLTNVARHANATRAELRVERVAGGVVLRVIDDGCGLDESARSSRGGLRGMREWALLVNGELDISAAPLGGTQVRLRVQAVDGEELPA